MQWSKELPKETWLDWVRDKKEGGYFSDPKVVFVEMVSRLGPYMRSGSCSTDCSECNSEWAGPIPGPSI